MMMVTMMIKSAGAVDGGGAEDGEDLQGEERKVLMLESSESRGPGLRV